MRLFSANPLARQNPPTCSRPPMMFLSRPQLMVERSKPCWGTVCRVIAKLREIVNPARPAALIAISVDQRRREKATDDGRLPERSPRAPHDKKIVSKKAPAGERERDWGYTRPADVSRV